MPFGAPSPSSSKKRGLGCAGCGCGLLLLIALLVVALVYSSWHTVLKATNVAPTPIQQVDGGPAVYAAVEHKIGIFRNNREHGRAATLRLDSNEINTYIARDPAVASLRGHLVVKLQGDEATVRSSIPLGVVESVVLPDRYADLDATFSLAFDPPSQAITVNAHDISLKGQPQPASLEPLLNQAINTIIAQRLQASAPTRDFLAHTQKLAIEKGELVIETK
jgi:hypothetical protein